MRIIIRSDDRQVRLAEGSVVAIIPIGQKLGNRETPESGYIALDVVDSDCQEFVEDSMMSNPEWSVINNDVPSHISTDKRKRRINFDSPLPINSSMATQSLVHGLRAGKTIRKHLSKLVVPIKKCGLLLVEEE